MCTQCFILYVWTVSRHILRSGQFQCSTKIIWQGNWTCDSVIFFTVHTTVIQWTWGILSVTQQSTHKTPHSAIKKLKETKKGNTCQISLSWLVDRLGKEMLDGLRKEYRLSRRVAPSSLQFGSSSPLYARPLMMTDFRASTNRPTNTLLLDPQCKWIAPNVFSRAPWFTF